MVVLPLGLGTRLRRLPVVTLLIIGTWLAVAVADGSGARITTGLLGVVARSGIRDATRDLFVQYCQSRQGEEARCRQYAVLVWTGFPGRAADVEPDGLNVSGSSDISDISDMRVEMRRATQLREDLADCADRPRCFAYKDINWRFSERERRSPQAFASLPGYADYRQASAQYRANLKKLCEKEQCLVRDHISLAALGAAQLRHGSFWHFVANAVVLLLFGAYAEQRGSRWLFFAIVVAGGTIGLAVHTRFAGVGDNVVLGGSANVSTALGLFYVFFFSARMRFWVWLPRRIYSGSVFYAPVKWCLPLFFVLTDVAGCLDSGFSAMTSARVAHGAHLIGLAVGLLGGLAITYWRRLPRGVFYEMELQDLQQLEVCRDFGAKLAQAKAILRINPDNFHAMEAACHACLKWLRAEPRGSAPHWRRSGRRFLATHLPTICAVGSRTGQRDLPLQLLEQMPMTLPFGVYLARLGQRATMALAELALARGQSVLALRLLDFHLTRYPLARQSRAIDNNAATILSRLPGDRRHRAALTAYLEHHPASPLADRIAAWLANARPEATSNGENPRLQVEAARARA